MSLRSMPRGIPWSELEAEKRKESEGGRKKHRKTGKKMFKGKGRKRKEGRDETQLRGVGLLDATTEVAPGGPPLHSDDNASQEAAD